MEEVMSLPRSGVTIGDTPFIVMDRKTREIVSIEGRQIFVSQDHAYAAAHLHCATFDGSISAEDAVSWFDEHYIIMQFEMKLLLGETRRTDMPIDGYTVP